MTPVPTANQAAERPPDVCIVTGEYPPAIGGVSDYTALLAHHLANLGSRVTVVTTARDGRASDPCRASVGGREIERIEIPGWSHRYRREIFDAVASAQADIVHLQYQTAAFDMAPSINVFPLLLGLNGLRLPVVTTFHDLRAPYLFPKAGPLRRLAVSVLLGASAGAIFTNPADLALARPLRTAAWIPMGPTLVPSSTSSRTRTRARWAIREDELCLAHFGFINATKGIESLVRAAERLQRANLGFRLLFIGDEVGSADPKNRATAARVRALAGELGVGSRITWSGFDAPPEISSALAAADLIVLPYADGASLGRSSLLSCLAHGSAVVTTEPTPSPPVASKHQIAPFRDPEPVRALESAVEIVPRNDDAALARAIYRLWNDAPRRARLAQAGRDFAARFTWPDVARATVAFYGRVLQRRTPG